MGSDSDSICVLIVEDEALVALDLQMTLEGLGARVCGVAASGPEAVEIAARTAPDLVLMDIRLAHGTDGIEAATAIRSARDVPVVFTSAHSDAATLARAMAVDPLAFLVKPHTPQGIARVLSAAAELRAGRAG